MAGGAPLETSIVKWVDPKMENYTVAVLYKAKQIYVQQKVSNGHFFLTFLFLTLAEGGRDKELMGYLTTVR